MSSDKAKKQEAIDAARNRIRSNRSERTDIHELAKSIVDGKRDGLAKGITLIESNQPEERESAHELLKEIKSLSNNSTSSLRIGITGIPGVGKSTFIEKLGVDLINEGHKVAVLAVDPSSRNTGGSILGDKTRMEKLSSNEMAFIRPSPAAETLGGVARATMEAILLCEAAGYDRVLVETVGVGQSEISVRDMVDVFTLLLIGGAGDELQGIKRGIVEMADLVVVHKADGDKVQTCNDTASAYRNSLHLFPQPKGEVAVEVLTASSLSGEGHDKFRSSLNSLVQKWKENDFFSSQRLRQRTERMEQHAKDLLFLRMKESEGGMKAWDELEQQMNEGELSAFSAAWIWANKKK